jgi:hypothetical protein
MKMEDGLLVQSITPKVSGLTRVVVYVPQSLRRKVIRLCHDTITSGHFYFWKTLKGVKRYFLWPGMTRDVEEYCGQCHICATRKKAGRRGRASMRRYDAGMPMEEICIDLMGPFPESERGNKYVLVVVDSFSKWMEAYPVKNIEAKTVAEALVKEFISRFGVPYWIKSDRGKQFECELFNSMCDLLEVDHRMSTAFHPQGNSRVERMVKVVGNLLSSYCNSQRHWDENLPLLTLAYRSTVHEVTGYTPNYVMMGREVLLPLDIMIGKARDEDKLVIPEYVKVLKERLESCFSEVRDQLKSHGERQRKYYDLSAHGKPFDVGTRVYMLEKNKKIGISPKLAPKWLGPFLVVQKLDSIYEVQITAKKSKMIHFDLLKECKANIGPGWLQKARRQLLAESPVQSN